MRSYLDFISLHRGCACLLSKADSRSSTPNGDIQHTAYRKRVRLTRVNTLNNNEKSPSTDSEKEAAREAYRKVSDGE
ncbi:MAG: hypothetical protein ABL903_20500 [Methylococcales bacterium]